MGLCRLSTLTLIFIAATAQGAGSLRVAPTRIDMPTGNRSTSITVTNTGRDLSLLQVQVMSWSQDGGNDEYTATDDVIASPPIFTLDGGGEQMVRIGLRHAAGKPEISTNERSYRLFVQEVPAANPSESRELNVVLRIGVPLFVTPANAAAAQLTWDLICANGKEPLLVIRNDGGRAQRIDELSIRAEGSEQNERAVYVLAGATRRITLNDVPAGVQQVELRGTSAQQEIRQSASCHQQAATNLELLLEPEINGVVRSEPALVRDSPTSGLLLRVEDLQNWGIRSVPRGAVSAEGFLPVTEVPGLRARIDFARQKLIVTAAPSLLPSAELALLDDSHFAPIPSVPGAFLGYDVVYNRETHRQIAAGQFDVGAFAGAWNLSNQAWISDDEGLSGRRLETTLQRDWPEHMTSLRVGDTLTDAGSWGRSVRIGGIGWGTDFGVRPDFITFPLPAVRGEANVPSTVDVYVNDVLSARRALSPGEFTLRDVPVVSGAGDIRLVVRDALGRERSIEQPYFATQELLARGLSAHSVQLGFIRESYGIESFDYGRMVAVGEMRRGLTDRTTGELRAEILERQQTAGATLNVLLRPGVLLTTAYARSESSHPGTLGQIGVDVTVGAVNGGVRAQMSSENFRETGVATADLGGGKSLDAHLSWSAGRAGTFSLLFADRDRRVQPDIRLLSVSYGVSLGPIGYLGAFATGDLAGREGSQLAIALTRAIGDRTSSRMSAISSRDGSGAGVAVARSLPAGSGTGFHVEADEGVYQRVRAGAAVQGESGTIGVDIERSSGLERYQARAGGALTLIGGQVAATRDTQTSFALIEVPSHAGVPVYRDNHPAAITNAQGFAVVPGLRPYEANRLSIDPGDLPIGVAIAGHEYSVKPYPRGAVRVKFSVDGQGGAVVHLVLDSGEFVPAGARVRVGEERDVTVANDGAIYLSDVSGDVTLEANWPTHRCTASVRIPDNTDLPDLGKVSCRQVL